MSVGWLSNTDRDCSIPSMKSWYRTGKHWTEERLIHVNGNGFWYGYPNILWTWFRPWYQRSSVTCCASNCLAFHSVLSGSTSQQYLFVSFLNNHALPFLAQCYWSSSKGSDIFAHQSENQLLPRTSHSPPWGSKSLPFEPLLEWILHYSFWRGYS